MLINVGEVPKVALEDMNEIHEDEIKIVNKLYEKILGYEDNKTDFEELVKVFEEFLNDVVNHFSFENSLMSEYNFFAYPMHRGEHDRVLFELKSLEKLLKENKDVETLKDYLVNNFKPWIVNHVKTMDTVTAMYLSNFL
ncbi:hemerythrin family protein [Sulfurihydrogenibium sp.]|uniref:bacteriohemerythrin n=1 Tax=Sulfurihydrogenibium sp. TaxID=2053621 RepID=UPI0026359AEB|nr:hemerythrin family protein [Sulfurihydrogenibium sp.]